MRKYIPAIILLIIPINIAIAQDSPFGNLTESQTQNSYMSKIQGKTVEDYVTDINKYYEILDMYDSSYGSQRTVLEEQLLNSAKEAMYSKFGAIRTYMSSLVSDATLNDRIPDEDVENLEGTLAGYEKAIENFGLTVQDATTIDGIRAISANYNQYLSNFLTVKNKHIVLLSSQKGLGIIDTLMGEIDLIRFHLDSAAELGHNVAPTKVKFDTAMLQLEESKDTYLGIQSVVPNVDMFDVDTLEDYVNTVANTNRDVINSHAQLLEVIADLRAFYGQSPWTVDFVRTDDSMTNDQNLEEEVTNE